MQSYRGSSVRLVSWRLRAFLVGIAIHRILPRAWAHQFRHDLAEANREARNDDICTDARTPQAENRIRFRKVGIDLSSLHCQMELFCCEANLKVEHKLNHKFHNTELAPHLGLLARVSGVFASLAESCFLKASMPM